MSIAETTGQHVKVRTPIITRALAYDIAIAFGQDTKCACEPVRRSDGGWDARVPMEFLFHLCKFSPYFKPAAPVQYEREPAKYTDKS